MAADLAKLLFGLLIVIFHRPIAEYVMRLEERLAGYFADRGWLLPAVTSEQLQVIYFCIGTLLSAVSLGRLWMALP
jgi:hypothetical protein